MESCFDNKVISLILTCKRPYYEKRLEMNMESFRILQGVGTVLVYLYADPALSETSVEPNNDGSYMMNVPCIETYDYLSKKILLAYQYFNKTKCVGVLKVDDDTHIKSEIIMKSELIALANKYDYFGVSEKEILKRDGLLKYNSRAKIADPVFQNIYHKINYNIKYYEGPFYYLSKRALGIVCNAGIELLFEDVGIGYILVAIPDLKTHLWKNMFEKEVYWNEKLREI
jgi:hypothetical protein